MPQIGVTLPYRFKQFLEKETVCSLVVTLSMSEVAVEKMEWYRMGKRITLASIASALNEGLPNLLQMRRRIGIVSYDETKSSSRVAFMKVVHKLGEPRDAGNTTIPFRSTWERHSEWKNSTQGVIAL